MSNLDYNIRDLVTIGACTNCGLCADVCPAVSAAWDGQLSGIYRLGELKKLLKRRAGILSRIFGKKGLSQDQLMTFSETVFRCTLCGNCQEVCPVGIALRDLWFCLRQDLVHSSAYPEKIDTIRDNLRESHNVFDEDNEERAEWVEDIREAPDHGFIKDQAEVVYFTGCVASYFPMAQKIPMALARIFQSADVDFTLLGEDEWCCGFPMLGAGLKDQVREIIDHNVDAMRGRRAEKIVFACPSCYQMWREHYPVERGHYPVERGHYPVEREHYPVEREHYPVERGHYPVERGHYPVERGHYHPEFELTHATQFLLQLIREERIPFKELSLTVTYHDPCDLGRGAGVYEEPREILNSIPGLKFVELPRNRENCRCCGGGGNLEMIDATLSADIAREKIDEIMSTGAEAVITACQQCVRTMNTYVRRNKVSLDVMDITQLIERAMKG